MSEIMRPIPFKNIMEWMKTEYKNDGSIFGVHKSKFYRNNSGTAMEIFGEKISSPVGPAAGPNSQLTQNIIASYLGGARFMELKTVQVIDGEELASFVARPCINVEDEGYNVEWSTELTVAQAREEYIKAWFALHVLAKEYDLAEDRDFIFNISLGYDLEGIKTEKIDTYVNNMIDASTTDIWNECKSYLLENIDSYDKLTKEDVEAISSSVSPSVTLSTLHGCPPAEINAIAEHLITEKGMHTYVKCNPTLLGYDFARETLDSLGYDYISFDDHHFNNDLQWEDAIPMFTHLQKLAKEHSLEFGLKLTNTFPVQIHSEELPGEEMYMSGRSLFPLSINLARKLSNEFKGTMPISYSGGADAFNVQEIFETGIQPITVATTILKPGGYERLKQMAEICEPLLHGDFEGIHVDKLNALADNLPNMKFNLKDFREKGSRKSTSELPLVDCFKSPCNSGDVGCPIEQQIPEYLKLVSDGSYKEAFDVISIDNAAPAITGTICDHQCENVCTRVDYDNPLSIRDSKKVAVLNAQDNFIQNMEIADLRTSKKVAIIGAGVAGTSSALFLRRNGVEVDVFERRDSAMGVVKYTIPEFRIPSDMVERDFAMAKAAGANFHFNVDADFDINELKKAYDFVIIAIGSWLKGMNPFKEGGELAYEALPFLEECKTSNLSMNLGKHVVVVGGGDVSMDCARSAKRTPGVEKVTLVYRRTKAVMPAINEELHEALEDGVEIMYLTGTVKYDGKEVTLVKNKLVDNKAVATDETFTIPADTVVNAIGTKVDTSKYVEAGMQMNDWGFPVISDALETSIENVYVAGDGKAGAKTIVKAIADAKAVAKDILSKCELDNDFIQIPVIQDQQFLYDKKGILEDRIESHLDGIRCLTCDQVCDICTDVCPNRANISINTNSDAFDQPQQILHVDGMCNECGNCGTFCPHAGRPYKDKVTLFWTEHDFVESTNTGFLMLSDTEFKVRDEDKKVFVHTIGDGNLSNELQIMLDTIRNEYSYFLLK